MNTHKNSIPFLATAGRGSRRAVLWATFCHQFGRSLPLPVLLLALAGNVPAQVNSGSDGHDGAFNPTATSTVINMADHPDGIYQYTEVNIPANVTVTFIPNAANTSVVWLVQSNCVISGFVVLTGQEAQPGYGGRGGPGGFGGGIGGGGGVPPGDGLGPGGGKSSPNQGWLAGNASFATLGQQLSYPNQQDAPGDVYGNKFLLPLLGGSGGGGFPSGIGGAGGGGAILIAATNITHNGSIQANGGSGNGSARGAGGGSGGGIRLVANSISGGGLLTASGGSSYNVYNYSDYWSGAGLGRIRLDALVNSFVGYVAGDVSRGFQPIIIAPPNQAVSLAIQSVAGVAVAPNPTGAPATPDVVVLGAQQNPVSIVVRCVNIPLNTDIIVDVKPANGSTVRSVGLNSSGNQASSTATVLVTLPRGAGTMQAKCVSGIAGSLGASLKSGQKFRTYAQTGLTADGEVFAKMEITTTLGRGQEIAYITESGKRFVLPRN